MTTICWHCGADLTPPRVQQRGDWLFYTDLTLIWGERQLRLPLHLRNVLYSLFRAYPEPLDSHVLAERLGQPSTKSVVIYLSKIRRWFRDNGIPCPVNSVQNGSAGADYYWVG